MEPKDLVLLTLDFWRYQIDNNLCTMEEIDSLSKNMQKGLDVTGTVSDFAKFCGVPEQYVRNILNRKVMEKPRRRVYHQFFPFIKNIPKSWLTDK